MHREAAPPVYGFLLAPTARRALCARQAFISCHGVCACTCVWRGAKQDDGADGCSFDTLQNTSAVTVTTWLKLEVREQAGKDRRFAANQMCGADDKCVVRVRNGGPSEERHRVVVRALMWGINDWRAASMAQAGRMVGVRRTMRRARAR